MLRRAALKVPGTGGSAGGRRAAATRGVIATEAFARRHGADEPHLEAATTRSDDATANLLATA